MTLDADNRAVMRERAVELILAATLAHMQEPEAEAFLQDFETMGEEAFLEPLVAGSEGPLRDSLDDAYAYAMKLAARARIRAAKLRALHAASAGSLVAAE